MLTSLTSVPHLAEMKSACATQISAYRSCLENNGDQPDEIMSERCGSLMKDLWQCSESTMRRIEGQNGGAGGTSGTASSGGHLM
jgi:hypothetical protein